jgi:capsular exopolysaccharide synthesis family protein
MTRLHDALRRAHEEGKAAILPPDAGETTGESVDSATSAFSVPWMIESAGTEPEPASEGPADGPSRPQAGFVPSHTRPAARVNGDVAEKLVSAEDPAERSQFEIAVEQYRKLAASLHQAQAERGLKVVLITSASPGEGKSLTATNLALTLSESYQRSVLLIDGDLHRPSLHAFFGAANVDGLSDGLTGASVSSLKVIQVSPRLSLLPSGRSLADPTTAISSPQMHEVVDGARAAYDWTIIDTPPVGLLSYAKLLADMVDGVVLVLEAGVTSYLDAQRAIDAVGRERVTGVVMNRMAGQSGDAKYYHSYYAKAGARRA